jgi:hypothetical protein
MITVVIGMIACAALVFFIACHYVDGRLVELEKSEMQHHEALMELDLWRTKLNAVFEAIIERDIVKRIGCMEQEIEHTRSIIGTKINRHELSTIIRDALMKELN